MLAPPEFRNDNDDRQLTFSRFLRVTTLCLPRTASSVLHQHDSLFRELKGTTHWQNSVGTTRRMVYCRVCSSHLRCESCSWTGKVQVDGHMACITSATARHVDFSGS